MTRDDIVQAALALAGTPAPGDDGFIEGLDVLVDAVARCPTASEAGRTSLYRQMAGHLANRFAIDAYLSTHPGLEARGIAAPVFVLGMPRTGTTLMVNLLNQDASARTLRKWEANLPVPPAAAGALSTDERCVRLNEERRREVADGKLATNVHFEWYDEPTECVYLMMQDFKSTAWDAFLPLPAYSAFLARCDMTPTYRWHRRVLQHLQQNNPGRWTLKAPGHALFARSLLDVYPDARLVWMHRDPHVAVASHASLAAGVHRRFQPEADLAWIASHYPGQLAAHVDMMMDVEETHPGQVFHVAYDALVRAPVETVERLYGAIGLPFDPATRSAIAARVASHPRGGMGRHDYDLGRFGIDPAAVDRLFARYSDRLSRLALA